MSTQPAPEHRKHPLRRRRPFHRTTGLRVVVAAAAAVVAGIATSGMGLAFSIMAGWVAGAGLYCIWVWLVVGRMDEHRTATRALEEDPSTLVAEAIVMLACLASLGGVAYLLSASSQTASADRAAALLGAVGVVAAWIVVHTQFALLYARVYYGDGPGSRGIQFTGGEPDYLDFAYLSFCLGMTYQISDTNLLDRTLRRIVLQHTLISYVFGVGVLATTVNLVGSLASGS